LVIW
jgi:Na+-driven multidrug efflux pump